MRWIRAKWFLDSSLPSCTSRNERRPSSDRGFEGRQSEKYQNNCVINTGVENEDLTRHFVIAHNGNYFHNGLNDTFLTDKWNSHPKQMTGIKQLTWITNHKNNKKIDQSTKYTMTAMRIFCIVSDKGRTFIGMSKLFGNIEEELSKSELLFILLNKILTILF